MVGLSYQPHKLVKSVQLGYPQYFMKKIHIPCRCGHYEGDHRDARCYLNACEQCGDCRKLILRFYIQDGKVELKQDPEFVCSGYKPMDGLEYIEWMNNISKIV